MTRDFSFVIVGGGILGCALANVAAAFGLDPLVIRQSDQGAPRADTLRNQGWLQSGIMYPISTFADPQAYATFAARTFQAGRDLLEMCGLPAPRTGGLLGLKSDRHRADLSLKRDLLRFSSDEFAQLATSEAKTIMGPHFEADSSYYRIPDGPFDEAAVLGHFRGEAHRNGAMFIEVDEPVRLARTADAVSISFDGQHMTTSTVVVTAGVASIGLMGQCGVTLKGELQRTPLVVGTAPVDMPASILIDLERGFSAVRHERGEAGPAVVMGTRTKTKNAPDPVERTVSLADQQSFGLAVPPGFREALESGRYTAGYELMPKRGGSLSPFEPWVHAEGPVLFASPGRATVCALAAQELLAQIIERRIQNPQRTTKIDLSQCTQWDCAIEMHYMNSYSFNDAED